MQVPDSEVPKLILGSKLAFMNWIWYLCYIWCLKAVLLCLYNKLTFVPLSPHILALYRPTLTSSTSHAIHHHNLRPLQRR